MKQKSELIVMLTSNDETAKNAFDIFLKCKNSKARYWGFKEKGLPPETMKQLCAHMKKCGKKTFLEVVAYTEKEGLKGAEMAVACGTDILMGTMYFDSINDYCKKHNLKYMPFVGIVEERPSILKGTAESMITEAKRLIEKGIYGIDLLGFRYVGDQEDLIHSILSRLNCPVVLAGSIENYDQLDFVKQVDPWAFTIGTAFFKKKFGEDFSKQIDTVYDYIHAK